MHDESVLRAEQVAAIPVCKAFGPIVVGVVLGMLFLQWAFGSTKTRFGDIALGNATFDASLDNRSIHGNDFSTTPEVIKSWEARGRHPVVLLFGNSQIHGVKQYEKGQANVALSLFRRYQPRGIDVLTFSQPSGSLLEHYVLFEYLLQRLKPSVLVLPTAFINASRSNDIREGIADCLRNDLPTREALEKTEIGRTIVSRYGNASAEDINLAGLSTGSTQVKVEQALNSWLDEHWSLWRLRPEARGKIVSRLLRTRNTLLFVHSSSERGMLPGAMQANLAALDAILQSARKHNVKVLIYTAPIRQDLPLPYVREDYEQFKTSVEKAAGKYGATYANLEPIVPAEHWGTHHVQTWVDAQQPDFYHFDEAGHSMLADEIAKRVDPLLQ